MVPLFALLVLVGCSSEPTGDLRDGPTELVATPTQLFLELGGVKNVEIGSVDAQGNPIDLNYEVTSTGAGITVRRDSSFLPIFVNDSTLQAPAVGPRFRFIVEGTGYAATSFTVSAGGLEIVVPVQVIPQAGLAATFDKAAYELGDTITLTAPAGVTFADTANLEIPGNPLIPVIVSQDATTIRFLAPPSVASPVIVKGVISASAPSIVFAPATDVALQTPLIDTVAVTYSDAAPAIGQSVTMTSTVALINLVVDSLIYPGQIPGREGDAQNIVVAADSNSLTFDAPPNVDGSGTVVNFAFPGGFLVPLPTLPTFTSDSFPRSLPATFSSLTPAVSEVVTVTAPAGFSFDTEPDTTIVDTDTTITAPVFITVGANPAIITSIAGDGSAVNFVPLPGSIGIPQIDGVVPDAAPSNVLTMPADDEVAVPADVPTLPGATDPSTAPSLTTPALGELSVLFDRPDFESTLDNFYELTVTDAGTYTITMDWNVGDDVDMFLCEDPPAADFSNCDFSGATGDHPEIVPFDLAPGTYFVVADDFGQFAGGGPAIGTTLVITVEHGPPAPPALRRLNPATVRKMEMKLRK